MEGLKKIFKVLLDFVDAKKEDSVNVAPVFSQVPVKLKNFATKTASTALKLKAKFSFETFEANINKRTVNSSKDILVNMASMMNWLVNMIKHILEKIDQQGDIITVHTEVLANPSDALDAKDEEIDCLKKELDRLDLEVDETRQRGMKGNLIISSPNRGNIPSLVDYKTLTIEGRRERESHTSLVKRLIKKKTGVDVKDREIAACHPMKGKNTFIISLADRSPGSSWELIVAGMKKGGNFKHEVNVFINIQLTDRRVDLASKARTARSDGKISKVFIDQNGKVKVKKEGADEKYQEVKTEADLYNFTM